jgi:serine/threonine-protein kinase
MVDVHFTGVPAMTGMGEADTDGPESSDSGVGKWSGSVPPPADEDSLVGTTLSNTYEVIRILGEGGMGRVYEAQHTRIQSKKFALKALHPEFARRNDILARFQREVEAAASINSPHVLGVYDVDVTEDGRPFLVSELLEGKELGDHLEKEGKVNLPWAVSVVRQICAALIEAHAQGVVHRDMKPENVFLTGSLESPLAKVLDFGISRLDGQEGNTLTKTGFIMGTPSYMAPEQAKGIRVDHRADIYSVGAIIYQMVTGRIPFDRADATATLAAVLTEEPDPPRSIAPDIPEHFEMIIQRAMAREPEDRYQTMAELDVALAAYDPNEMGIDEPSRSLRLRPAPGSMVDATEQAREATQARPQLALYGALAIVGTLLGLVSAVAAVLRLSKDGAAPTVSLTEALVIVLVLVAALSTPMVLLLRHIKKSVWPNTAKVLELLRRLKPPVLTALVVFGAGGLLLRSIESVLLRTATGIAWAGWDLILPVFAMGCGVAVYVGRGTAPGRRGPLDRLGLAPAVALVAVLGLVMMGGAMGLRGGASAGVQGADEASVDEQKEEDEGFSLFGGDDDAEEEEAPEPTSSAPPLTSKASIAQWNKILDHMKLGHTKSAIDALGPLLELDPNAPADKNVRAGMVKLTVRGCLKRDETCTKMLDLLTEGSGHHGPDILYEILITKGGTSAHEHASRLLQVPAVRKRATQAMRIAYDLRTAKGCDERKKLLPRAIKYGDHRARRELKILDSRGQCRLLKCCDLIDDKDLEAAIDAIDERL